MRPCAPPLVAVAVAVLALAGCGSSEPETPRVQSTAPVVQLGAPGQENRTLGPDEQLVIPTLPHTDADVAFVRGMLHHHAQALTMTGLVDERTEDRDVRLLAKRMRESQDDEIDQMERWLTERGETVNDLSQSPHGHGDGATMPGMLTEDELAELEAARDEEFDRTFLEYMIRHHQGALTMVEDLYAAAGGQEPQLGQIAQHVDSDQRIEIARMATMLSETS